MSAPPAESYGKGDDLREVLRPFADIARCHCADAPEWHDHDVISVVVRVEDLRAVLDAFAD